MSAEATGIRATNRARLEAEILRLGRIQLAEVGPAALSLRAVARELGMASSAVYRYVASRDELLTLLIIESYDAMADFVQEALREVPREDLRGRWLAVGHSVRAWAVAHPQDWALLYGSPVPGYAAPADRTTDPGTRVQLLLVDLMRDIVRARRVAPASRRPELTPQGEMLASQLAVDLGLASDDVPPALLLAGMSAWSLLIASVANEVFQQFGELGSGYVVLHESALDVALRLILR